MPTRTIARVVETRGVLRLMLSSRTRSQLLAASRLLRRIASISPQDAEQAAAARNAADWASRVVGLSLAGVSPETKDARSAALPPGDRP